MTEKKLRKRGRPTRTVLTTERIVDEARGLLITVGEGFTMSTLASRLGVAASSLYNHVGSKDEVLATISDDLTRDIEVDELRALAEDPGIPRASAVERARRWRRATEAWARSYYAAFATQPSMVNSFALTPVARAPQTLAMYEGLSRGFLAAGWPEGRVLRLIESLEAFLLGSALDAAAPDTIFDPGDLDRDFPAIASLYRLQAGTTAPEAAAEAFDLGLSGMLDGLEAQLVALLA